MVTVLAVLSLARSWIGKNEADGSHQEIINIYNGHKPLARGYAVKYTDAWCATFISALFIKLGVYDFLECGCPEMVEKLKALGWWKDKGCTPSAGYIPFYDWDGDGVPDHVGIVDSITNGTLQVIEGNYKDSVGVRSIGADSPYIIGYGVLPYAVDKVSTDTRKTYTATVYEVRRGDKNVHVLLLQEILKARKYYNGPLDWEFGDGTEKALRWYQQDRINAGVNIGGADGKPDGVCGSGTWSDLLGVQLT